MYRNQEDSTMSLATKIIFIAALVLSIIIPFGYYLIGEKNKKRYKRTIGVNAFFFFGAFAIASIMMLAGPANVQAAETAAASGATLATGMGYLAAALVTGLSCIGGGIAVASAASAAQRERSGVAVFFIFRPSFTKSRPATAATSPHRMRHQRLL